MRDVAAEFAKIKIVPVVKIDDVKDAVPLAEALVEGGLPCAEVTFRTEAAAEARRHTAGSPFAAAPLLLTSGFSYRSSDGISPCSRSSRPLRRFP